MKKIEEGVKLLMFRFFEVHKMIVNKSNKICNKDGFGLQVEQVPVLMLPYFLGILSQQEIADKLLRDKSSVLRTVTSLSQSGLLVVAADPFDKRRKLVQLTNEGRKLANKIAEDLSKIDAMVFDCLSEAEKESLTGILKKLEQNLEKI